MGLDMYAWAVPASVAGDTQTDFLLVDNEGTEKTELAYWRKFNHLHGWMERLYYAKGGTDEQFNCVSVRLDIKDLDDLVGVLLLNQLSAASGFFFGSSDIYPEHIERTHVFIKEARQAIADGNAVFYNSWW